MKSDTQRSHPLVRTRRRAILFSTYASVAVAMTVSFAATPAAPRGGAGAPRAGAATRPAAATPNPAAAETQFQVAKALFDQQKFADAQTENEKALALDPANANALLLRSALKPKLANLAGTGTGGSTGSAQGGTNVKPGVLTQQQISAIRLMELNPDRETALRGNIDRKSLEDFWSDVVKKDPSAPDTSQAAHDAFIRTTNFPAQVFRIRDSSDHKYMEKINITSDPINLVAFKTVNTFVTQYCADCHVGDKGGNFHLLTPSSAPSGTTPEQIVYTNFYIMSQYTGKDGGLMIDRQNPEKSLFLQYALPKTVAKLPHPAGELAKKLGPNDSRLNTWADWIKSLAFPKPNYGISFELPATNPK